MARKTVIRSFFVVGYLNVPRVKIGGCVIAEKFLPPDFLIGDEQDSMSAGHEGVERGDWKRKNESH